MSKAVQCDRCGKLKGLGVALTSDRKIFSRGGIDWQEITTAYDINTGTTNSLSLCPTCSKEFEVFMNAMPFDKAMATQENVGAL